MTKDRLLNNLVTNLLLLLLSGFLVIGVVSNFLGLKDDSITIKFRVFVLLLSIALAFLVFLFKRRMDLKKIFNNLFVFFWLIYSLRIIVDIFIIPKNLGDYKEISFYPQFAFGAILIPCLCLIYILNNSNVDYSYLFKSLHTVLFVTILIAIYNRSQSDLLSGRSAGDLNVGILLVGQYCASLFLLSFFQLVYYPKMSVRKIVYYALSLLVGILGIVISASKSPVISVLIVLLIFILYFFSFYKGLLTIIISSVLIFLFFIQVFTFLSDYLQSDFLFRLLYAIDNGDESRNQLIYASFEDFMSNPILGNAFLIQKTGFDGSYPHNLIVESFMATGLIGGLIFIRLVIGIMKRSVRLIKEKNKNLWLGLLFLQYLLFGMFSGNLYSSQMFWFLIIIILVSFPSILYTNKNVK